MHSYCDTFSNISAPLEPRPAYGRELPGYVKIVLSILIAVTFRFSMSVLAPLSGPVAVLLSTSMPVSILISVPWALMVHLTNGIATNNNAPTVPTFSDMHNLAPRNPQRHCAKAGVGSFFQLSPREPSVRPPPALHRPRAAFTPNELFQLTRKYISRLLL
ncbi:hypothetical protein EVAR_408_1 [Eumeta japonica]|uniref:Uncharacterized protein n=1 Tax=Eumeta variegata TaxID=151549 RepID=A0A4C1SB41_EUMVA|nr:hypothetical protein EVAR_408_1 [Eumeta japonica]